MKKRMAFVVDLKEHDTFCQKGGGQKKSPKYKKYECLQLKSALHSCRLVIYA
jgi:hypothetical protein